LPYHFLNGTSFEPLKNAKKNKWKVMAINLPGFAGVLSHFTQPGKSFADELRDRLKVIACLERPNMICSEDLGESAEDGFFDKVSELLCTQAGDAQVVLWGPEDDMATALETVEERCRMAFEGVPNETRKSFADGTTIFERVLPGADRMYPDTDSPPIPLEDERIRQLGSNLPTAFISRYQQLKAWGIPEDTFTFLFKRNLYPLLVRCIEELDMDPVFTGTFFGHRVKWAEGRRKPSPEISYEVIFALFRYLKKEGLQPELAYRMLPLIFEHPKMDFESVLNVLKFKRISKEDLISNIPFLREKFRKISISQGEGAEGRWIMGQLWKMACGNMPLSELSALAYER
ncbi:MAG TPA: hypothetical protein P5248_13285, partial [Bacteroidales bacterium]|nr:hypothetical protein [Bacteroidales bacterium]